MKQESESYYALTISIYASKEIQEQAKHGERWIGPDEIIVKVVHVAKGKRWIAQKYYEATVTAMANPLAFEVTVFRQPDDPMELPEVLISMIVKHPRP